MPMVQVNIPKRIDPLLRHYMIDAGIESKEKALVRILEEKFGVIN